MSDQKAMRVFFEICEATPKQGPGDEASTLKALGLCKGLASKPEILDVGCGNGQQSLTLARATGGRVVAVDTHGFFLDRLQLSAARAGLDEHVTARNMDMRRLEFPPDSFDLIWSEGAIYLMGFDQGLSAWRPLLRSGGYIAVTELSWLSTDPPHEARAFWEQNYPGMRHAEENSRAVERHGYQLVGSFTLPASAWWSTYYGPQQDVLNAFRRRYASDAEALAVVEEMQQEIDLFRRHSDAYGYVFYVARQA